MPMPQRVSDAVQANLQKQLGGTLVVEGPTRKQALLFGLAGAGGVFLLGMFWVLLSFTAVEPEDHELPLGSDRRGRDNAFINTMLFLLGWKGVLVLTILLALVTFGYVYRTQRQNRVNVLRF